MVSASIELRRINQQVLSTKGNKRSTKSVEQRLMSWSLGENHPITDLGRESSQRVSKDTVPGIPNP